MTVHVVTDSTSDLPPKLAAKLGITVVPLNVHFGEETFRDGEDLGHDEFYNRLTSVSQLPTTSAPPVGTFLAAYQKAAKSADGIVSIHLSSDLSATFDSARQASEQMSGTTPVEVLDSRTISLGLGMVALAAARAAGRGASTAEVVEEAQRAMGEVEVVCAVDTLEYLEKGGRIGKGAAFMGSLLNVKPLLTVRDGKVHPLEKVRARARAISRLVEIVEAAHPVCEIGVMHSTTPEEADSLAKRLAPGVPNGNVLVSQLGVVVGTHSGPGLIGVGFRRGNS